MLVFFFIATLSLVCAAASPICVMPPHSFSPTIARSPAARCGEFYAYGRIIPHHASSCDRKTPVLFRQSAFSRKLGGFVLAPCKKNIHIDVGIGFFLQIVARAMMENGSNSSAVGVIAGFALFIFQPV
jgi:hypothetical protein